MLTRGWYYPCIGPAPQLSFGFSLPRTTIQNDPIKGAPGGLNANTYTSKAQSLIEPSTLQPQTLNALSPIPNPGNPAF